MSAAAAGASVAIVKNLLPHQWIVRLAANSAKTFSGLSMLQHDAILVAGMYAASKIQQHHNRKLRQALPLPAPTILDHSTVAASGSFRIEKPSALHIGLLLITGVVASLLLLYLRTMLLYLRTKNGPPAQAAKSVVHRYATYVVPQTLSPVVARKPQSPMVTRSPVTARSKAAERSAVAVHSPSRSWWPLARSVVAERSPAKKWRVKTVADDSWLARRAEEVTPPESIKSAKSRRSPCSLDFAATTIAESDDGATEVLLSSPPPAEPSPFGLIVPTLLTPGSSSPPLSRTESGFSSDTSGASAGPRGSRSPSVAGSSPDDPLSAPAAPPVSKSPLKEAISTLNDMNTTVWCRPTVTPPLTPERVTNNFHAVYSPQFVALVSAEHVTPATSEIDQSSNPPSLPPSLGLSTPLVPRSLLLTPTEAAPQLPGGVVGAGTAIGADTLIGTDTAIGAETTEEGTSLPRPPVERFRRPSAIKRMLRSSLWPRLLAEPGRMTDQKSARRLVGLAAIVRLRAKRRQAASTTA